EFEATPAPETVQIYEAIRDGTLVEPSASSPPPGPQNQTTTPTTISRRQDWGEAPDTVVFYGRQSELSQLKSWLIDDRCRLVALLGMGGQGKTALAAKISSELAEKFDVVIWRSLLNAPPLTDVIRSLLQFLSDQQLPNLPANLGEQLGLLLDYLRRHRCLLILDNVESIMDRGDRAGHYRPGYEGYGQLIQRAGESRHHSCLLLTSREKPREYTRLEGETVPVRSLQLGGLDNAAGQKILHHRRLSSPIKITTALVTRYSGNPLALKLVSETIHDLFEGDIAGFLSEEAPVFDDIRDVLDQQFARLSPIELEIMLWLAIEREAISLEGLIQDLARPLSRRDLLEALRSLQRRSLLERHEQGFALQNVVMEYTTDRLLDQVYQEFEGERLSVLHSHALLKAQAKEYIRQSQTLLILSPLVERLLVTFGPAGLGRKFQVILNSLREGMYTSGYAAGNILNLLLYLQTDLRPYDFSGLFIRQAYLRGAYLPDVNFAGATLQQSVFTDTFSFVHAVGFSPDGSLRAAGMGDGEIRLWRTADGQPVNVLNGHTSLVCSLAFSPIKPQAGHYLLASCSEDQTVRLWNAQTGQLLHTLTGHTHSVRSVAFSPDPDQAIVASAGWDNTIRLWHTETGELTQTLTEPAAGVLNIAFSPDLENLILAIGSDDHTIRLWDVSGNRLLHTLEGHEDGGLAVAFSPDGRLLASGGADHTVRLWEVETGQLLHILRGHNQRVWDVAFSPNGALLASSSWDQTIRLWRVSDGHPLNTLRGHTDGVVSVAFKPAEHDQPVLASGGYDQTIRLWEAKTGHALDTLRGHINWIWAIAHHPHQPLLASGSWDKIIRLWDLQSGQTTRLLQGHDQGVLSVAFSPDGATLASGSWDATIRVWDTTTVQTRHILRGHDDTVVSIAFSRDGRRLVSGSTDHTVRVWDLTPGEAPQILTGHHRRVWAVALSPDDQTIASGSWDTTIRLWDAERGDLRQALTGHEAPVLSVQFSPDGALLASGSGDHTVRLWEVKTGAELAILSGHTDMVSFAAFSPDGKILASGGADHTIRLWEVHSRKLLSVLEGHSHWVLSAEFSPDGAILISSSADETIKLWDWDDGRCRQTLRLEEPYANMNISGVKGLTEAQKAALKALGAVES
ncbi:MAG: NB-ARC domain-containing protein, partial [Anaerolineae bacterium]|nr:NB-ARC domain-containing protein [Anaerolineae bacterium]